jgi:hypothetical protein
MNAVVVRLVGGLGNQMFQYAAARALAVRAGVPLELDLSWFGSDPDRHYALAPFSIEARLREPQSSTLRSKGLLARVSRWLRIVCKAQGIPAFREASYRYDARIEHALPPVFLDGYFQSEKYFSTLRQQIATEFMLRDRPAPAAASILDKIASCDAICVHIRRGDYVSSPAANAYHGTCSLDYYYAGLAQVSKGLLRPHCFVFSDDPAWVRENFRPECPMTLVDIHRIDEAHEDLRLMAACQHYVIANSSLSWWGAWLGAREGKLVVAPLRWFQQNDIDTNDLIPPAWIRL